VPVPFDIGLEILASILIAAFLTQLSRPLAHRLGAVAKVRSDRWHRAGDIPRLAGPALLLALTPWIEWYLSLGLAAFCAIGVRDDLRPLLPLAKALLLLVPCVGVAWLFGEPWIALACWVAANAFNMLDHADGTASATCIGSLVVAGDELGWIGAAACLGFLVFNWPPARVFLGDSGSLMLGAFLTLAWYPHGILAMLAGLAVPLIDALFVVISRLKAGRPPWQGGTDHTAHHLLRAGVHPRWLPLIYGGTAAAVALAGKTYL
jgi:UDP-GlcNAc:undecaprenyl-phosphate/decaprenyl-phosphate GlcNAc-1-phosphate transferase